MTAEQSEPMLYVGAPPPPIASRSTRFNAPGQPIIGNQYLAGTVKGTRSGAQLASDRNGDLYIGMVPQPTRERGTRTLGRLPEGFGNTGKKAVTTLPYGAAPAPEVNRPAAPTFVLNAGFAAARVQDAITKANAKRFDAEARGVDVAALKELGAKALREAEKIQADADRSGSAGMARNGSAFSSTQSVRVPTGRRPGRTKAGAKW